MGYYSDVEVTVKIDIDKVADMMTNNTVITKSNTETLADTIKSSIGVQDAHEVATKAILKNVYDDWTEVFINDSYLLQDFEEFLGNGVLDGRAYGVKLYGLSSDLKNFVEKYGDAIVHLDGERTGEDNEDIERFEVRNLNGKNILYTGTPTIEFKYTPA